MAVNVGNTPLQKSIEMCGRCRGAAVYIKREDKNPFGTFKDRRCAALLEIHRNREEVIFVHITSGNSGYSLGMMAKEEERKTGRRITIVNLIPKGTSKAIKERLESCSVVREIDVSKEIISLDRMKAIAREATGYNGPERNIVHVEEYGLANGYRNIVKEIASEGIKPSYIFCPVGEGELATELAAASESVWGKDAPKIVGVTIKQNTILRDEDFLPNPGKSIADKLVNGYSKFKQLVKNFIENGRIELLSVSESEIAKEYSYLNNIGINVEPSAAVAFCGAEKYNLKPEDVVVIINTGKGIYDQKAVDKLWRKTLLSALKYAAVATAAVLLTFAGHAYKKHQDETKAQIHWGLLAEARNIAKAQPGADKNKDGEVDYKEEESVICGFLYDNKDRDECIQMDIYCLTPTELQFYIQYNAIPDYISRSIYPEVKEKFLKGEWKPPYKSNWRPPYCP